MTHGKGRGKAGVRNCALADQCKTWRLHSLRGSVESDSSGWMKRGRPIVSRLDSNRPAKHKDTLEIDYRNTHFPHRSKETSSKPPIEFTRSRFLLFSKIPEEERRCANKGEHGFRKPVIVVRTPASRGAYETGKKECCNFECSCIKTNYITACL